MKKILQPSLFRLSFMALLWSFFSIQVAQAQCATTWTSRTSAADNTWNSVTYGNGLYVAVAGTGTGNRVMTSSDGITWTSRSSAADNSWCSITYGNGLFVATASSGTGNRVMTSPDGLTWTSRTSAADNSWLGVTYGNGLFVAVAWDGTNRVMTSPDGITWTSRISAAANGWTSVTYGNGLFVAVANTGTGNRVMTSPDGITWTSRTTAVNNNWCGVTYGNGVFVAVAPTGTGNRVMTSPDGITWTIRSSAADNGWTSVTYGNGLFVAVSLTGTGNRVMTSPDGITWTSRTSAVNNGWQFVGYGNDLFVAVSLNGTGNRVMTSSPFNKTTAASTTPTLCVNSSLTNITHTTTGATGIGAATGLPAGVTAAWAANTITISGTPTASGTFNYSIPLTGGCGTVNASGIITVNSSPTFTSFGSSSTAMGNSLVITGTNLTGTTSVRFGATPALFTVNSNTQITATVPRGANNGVVSISKLGGCSALSTSITVNRQSTSNLLSRTTTIGTSWNGISISGGVYGWSAPTFTDLDGDGLLDLIIGEQDGNLNHYEQNAANSTSFTLITPNFNGIDVGERSKPAFTDLDGDGLLDMIVGEGTGGSGSNYSLNHYEQDAPNSTSFTLITANFNGIYGYQASFTDLDSDGLLDMMVNTGLLSVDRYEQNAANSTSFTLIPPSTSLNQGGSIGGGLPTSTFTDLDGDGLLNMICGAAYGELYHYEQNAANSASFTLFDYVEGVFGTSVYTPGFEHASNPTITDLDGDGLLDMIVGHLNGELKHFEQTQSPIISTLSVNSACQNATVSITGIGFTGATSVTLNGTSVGTLSGVSATNITFTIPANATSGNVVVTTPSGTSNAVGITITQSPTTPTITAGGATAICAGNNTTLTTTATLGANEAYLWSDNSTNSTLTVSTAGTFSLRIINTVTGCTSAASNAIVVTLNSTPIAPTLTTGMSYTSSIGGFTNNLWQVAISAKGVKAIADEVGNVFLYSSVNSTTPSCTLTRGTLVTGVAFSPDGTKLLLTEQNKNRVVIYNAIPTIGTEQPDVVIGQIDMTATTAGTSQSRLYAPRTTYVSPNGQLFIVEFQNHRITVYNQIPTTNAANADLVIGQPDFATRSFGTSGVKMYFPWDVAVSPDGKLLVSDSGNNRVLIFNTVPTVNGAAADFVIGQTSLTSASSAITQSNLFRPLGIAISPFGSVAIADGNNRVMIYNSIPTANGVNANLVVGQPNYTTNTSGTAATAMNTPYGVGFSLDGRLLVAENTGKRVNIYGTEVCQMVNLGLGLTGSNSACQGGNVSYTFTITNPSAFAVSGVYIKAAIPRGFTLTTNTPSTGTYNAAGGVWSIASIAANSAATLVLSGNTASATGSINVQGAIFGSSVSDNDLSDNVASIQTVIGTTPTISGPTGFCAGGSIMLSTTYTLGANEAYLWSNGSTASTLTVSAANVASSPFSLRIRNTVTACTSAVSNIIAVAQNAASTAPSFTTGMSYTSSTTFTNKLSQTAISSKGIKAIADNTGTVFLYASVNATTPYLTLTSTSATIKVAFSPDGNKLLLAETSNNRVLVYNSLPTTATQSPDVVIGQPDFNTITSGINSDKFYAPLAIHVSANGKLFIPDLGNRRVLIYNRIPTTNGAAADVVVGQNDFITATSGILANQMNRPDDVAVSPDGKLLVSDFLNNRVLVFNTVPTTNGASANVVIGQADFTTSTAGTSNSKLNYPYGISISPAGVLAIAESWNNRVLIYNSIPTTSGAAGNLVIGQPDFTSGVNGATPVSANTIQGVAFSLDGRLLTTEYDGMRVNIYGTEVCQTGDLTLSLSGNTSACLGGNVTYTYTLNNTSSSAVSNVYIKASLPQAFTYTSNTAASGTYNTAGGVWTIPSIPANQSYTLVINGSVGAALAAGTYDVQGALIGATISDNNGSNNGVSIQTVVNPLPTLNSPLTPAAICSNTAFTYSPTSATAGATFTWTRAAVAGISNAAITTAQTSNPNEVLINTNSAAVNVVYSYITTANGCAGTAQNVTVMVSPNNTVSAPSSTPTLCNNTLLTNITHTTTGATGIGLATGLPAGVTAAWASNTITISGTPTASGTFSYSIPLSGGCGTVNATGIITVNSSPTFTSFGSSSTAMDNSLVITGTNLTGTTSVKFGETPALFTVNSNTQITATVPRVANTGKVNISNSCGSALSTSIPVSRQSNSNIFSSVTANFNAITIGGNSTPAFTDLDGDGLLDILVGAHIGTLKHYEQNTANSTSFTWVTSSFNGIDVGASSAPAFTDLDGDGLLDMIIGEVGGTLKHYEQNAANSTSFTLINAIFNGINIGTQIAPTFTDLDGDGLLDMLVGEWDGNLNHYEQNSVNSTSFTLITSNFNGIDVSFKSAPTFTDLDGDGLLDMLIGAIGGNLNHFEQITANSTSFTLITENFNAINVGAFSSPTFTDLDGDGLLDMIIGEVDGNLNHYEQNQSPIISTLSASPACQNATVSITGIGFTGATSVTLNGTSVGTLSGVSATNITFTVPANATSGNIVVTTPSGTSNAVAITVSPNNTAGAASSTPTLCINTALTNITHTTTVATGIGTATGLPTGVTAAWAANTITISGTPTASGIFNYTIPLTGGCGTVNATGTIVVFETPSITIIADPGNSITTGTAVTFTAFPTNGGSTPAYQWKKNGDNVGTNSFTYTDLTLVNGDVIACLLSNNTYASPATATSNSIIMEVSHCPVGTNWTIRTSATDNDWNSVTYGNGLYVAVAGTGAGNRVMTSPDGTTWTSRSSAADNSWTSITYGNGLFVAVSSTGNGNRVMTSPDGILWSVRSSAADNSWSSVTYGNGMFVAVAKSGSNNRVMTSPNGITWTSRISAADNGWQSVTYGNGIFLAVASDFSSNSVMTSSDGIIWAIRTPPSTNVSWTAVTYGNGLFVAVGDWSSGNGVMTSPNGITWTIRASAADNNWRSVTYGSNIFVAVAQTGASNRIMTSSNGITWTSRTSGVDNQWQSVTYGNGLFVAVAKTGAGNRVMTSSPTNTATAASSSPTLCTNTPLTAITHTTTFATGIGIPTGLPNGLTATWASNKITISGTPTASGTFSYSIPLTGGCGTANAIGTITATPSVNVSAASDTPILCINTPLTNITHVAAGATSILTSSEPNYTLPPAVLNPTGNEDLSNVTISLNGSIVLNNSSAVNSLSGTIGTASGTAGSYSNFTAYGPYNLYQGSTYDFSLSSISAGTINKNNSMSIYIDYNRNGVFTDAGEQVYISTNISGPHTRTGTFTVPANAVSGLTRMRIISNEGLIFSPTQSVFYGEFEEYRINLGATNYGLPAGVAAALVANIVTISGTPTEAGTFSYAIPLAGGCDYGNATGTITVNTLPTLSNNSGGASAVCINATTPAFTNAQSGGTWSIIPGTGTASVSLGGAVTGLTAGTVSVVYTGTCSNSVSSSVTVKPNITSSVASSTPTLCINTPLTNINHTTEGATGIGTAAGLPAGVTAAWISNTITISGTPTEAGTFNYSIPLTGGCGSVNATGSITVNDMPSPPTITGNFDFCAGSTTTLSAGSDSSRQYAATVLGFSSEYTSNCGPFSSCKVLGAPNVYPIYGDLAENWANASPNGGLEYLDLGFSNPTPISYVDIYETFSPGSVTQVSVKNNTTGLYEVVYNATAAPAPGVARILHITFPLTNYDVSAVRIDMDTALFGTWIEIDAVAIGAENPDTYLWSNGQTTSSIAVTTEGEYSVTVTNADGCSATSEVTTVIVNQPAIETTVATSCGMYVWEAGNYSDYFETGTYSYTENCVMHILELTVIEPTTETTVATSCGTYTWPINGSDYMTSGSYSYDTQDCVHHILELTVSPLSIPTITASGSTSLCQGESINLTVDNESNVDTLPLNEVGGATLAVGLRKLKSDYAGSALRLRRSSDNQEQDFGFAGDNLDTTAISTWLDGADGFCTTLYDQSGNGGHVTQSDVNAQPIYVASGINNKPILHFNTAQSMFNEVNYPAPFSAIYGARMTGTSARLLASRYNNWLLGYWNGYMDVAFFEGFLNNGVGPEADNSFNIFTGTGNGNISTVYKNGTQLYSDSGGVDGPNGIQLNGSNDEYSDCDFTDVMLFGTELSSQDIVKLNTSISNYYTTNNSSSNAVSYLWSNGATTPSIEVSTAGDYTVTVTNSAGCSATSAATAVIVNSCEVPTGQISGNASLCAGNSTQLSIALTGQGPWSGTLSDGTGFSGSDNPLLVTVTPSETTTYTIATLSSETATAIASGLSGSAVVEVKQLAIWYADTDMDTFGDITITQSSCIQPAGYVSNSLDCNDNAYSLTNSCNSVVNLKLFIEGYYAGAGTMASVLNNQSGDGAMTDVEMVTVELFDATLAPVTSTTAMLHTDGTCQAVFTNSPTGAYYVAVRGSNSIRTWTAFKQTVGNTPLTYDFSTEAAQAAGGNMKDLGSGVYGFYSGDLDLPVGDGFIDVPDYTIWETDYNNSAIGAYPTDMDGDGFVDVPDYTIWEANYNASVLEIQP